MWIDAPANFYRFANSKDNIREDLKKAKDAGITNIVVDVRPYTGDVLFNSSTADAVTQLDYWDGLSYKYFQRTATWDYLQAFIDIGHELGLKVDAAINTFVGGSMNPYGLGGQGMLFRDSSRKSWATVYNLASGRTNCMDLPSDDSHYYATRFLDPCNDVLNIIGDLAKYDLDGIVLDRCRFDNLLSDVSDNARDKFATYMQAKGISGYAFPDDVVKPGSETVSGQPKYFQDWLAFRAKTIYDFIGKVVARVRSVNSNIKVATSRWASTSAPGTAPTTRWASTGPATTTTRMPTTPNGPTPTTSATASPTASTSCSSAATPRPRRSMATPSGPCRASASRQRRN